jgi:hypothetical protein
VTPAVRRIVRVLVFLAGLSLLIYVVSRYPLADIAASLRRIGAAWLLTPLIALVWHLGNTRGFQILVGHGVRYWPLLRAKLAAEGTGNLMPFGSVAAEAFRMRQVADLVPSGAAVGVVLGDRATGDSIGFLYSAVAAVLLALRAPAAAPALYAYAAIAAVAGIALFVLVTSRFPGRIGAFVARKLGAPPEAPLAPPPPRKVIRTAGWQLVGRAAGLVEVALLLWRLGLPHDPLTCLCVHGGLAAAGYITFASPTGVGVMDAATVIGFGLLGYPGDAAVAFALSRRARLLFVSLGGALLYALTRKPTAPPST